MPLALLAVGALISGTLYLLRSNEPRRHDGPPSPRAEGEIALLLPVTVDADADHAWVRLGLMDLITTRLREAGQAMVPSDTVIALSRGVPSNPSPDQLDTLAGTFGAQLVLTAQAQVTGVRWTVSLHSLLGAQPPLTAVGEANDVLEAARTAADQMARSLGLVPAPESTTEPDLATLLQKIEAAILAQQHDVARALIEDAAPELRQHPEIRFQSGRIEYYHHNLDAAQAIFESLAEKTTAKQAPVLRARILNALAAGYLVHGDSGAAEPLLTEAARLLGGRQIQANTGIVEESLGTAAQWRGDFDSAREHMAQARKIFEGIGDVQRLANHDLNVGVLEAQQERFSEALHAFKRAAERHAAVQNVRGELLARSYMIRTHLLLLDPQTASALEPRLDELLDQTDNPFLATQAGLTKAYLLEALGQARAASGLVKELLSATEGSDLHLMRMAILLLHAEQAERAGELADAARIANQVVGQIPPGYGPMAEDRGRAWLISVRAHLARGDLAAAREACVAMYHWANGGSALLPRILAALAEAELAAAEDRNEAAESSFEHALTLADGSHAPMRLLEVAESYVPWLLIGGRNGTPDPVYALQIADRVAGYADQHYEAALLQLRVYHALGPPSAWRAALARATSLRGERRIPPPLLDAPQPGRATVG